LKIVPMPICRHTGSSYKFNDIKFIGINWKLKIPPERSEVWPVTVFNGQFKWGTCLNYLQTVNAFAMGPCWSNLTCKFD